jgi:hypothetical protein
LGRAVRAWRTHRARPSQQRRNDPAGETTESDARDIDPSISRPCSMDVPRAEIDVDLGRPALRELDPPAMTLTDPVQRRRRLRRRPGLQTRPANDLRTI